MIIRVEKHTNRYTVIDNSGLNDVRLSLKSRGLLGHLLTKPDNWEISVSGIVSSCPDGKDSVQSALKELERFGYAEYRTVRGDRGRVGGKKWVIFERSNVAMVDNQESMSDSDFHRQPGFPIIGKTDYRKIRLSENPLQVSTVTEVSTELKVNTVTRVHGSKKNDSEISVKASVDQPPPIALHPPRESSVLFSDRWDGRLQEFFSGLKSYLPSITQDESDYYYGRCRDWSAKKGSKSSNWLLVAAGMQQQDSTRDQQKRNSNQQKSINHDTEHSKSNSTGIDLVRATKRAARFAERNGLTIGPFD